MKKTMYTAMNSLAKYIENSESRDFNVIWKEWSDKYQPPEEMIPRVKTMGLQLCQIDKQDINNVPERKYRDIIKKTLKPEINKEELDERNESN